MSTNESHNEEIARSIINDILNNNWVECDQKIKLYGDSAPVLSYCAAFLNVIKAILSFDNSQFDTALKYLNDCQKMCKNEPTNKSAFASMRRLFNMDALVNTQLTFENLTGKDLEEKINNEILMADCKFYSAALLVAQHKSVASVITGILDLRRAWIIYEAIHKKLHTYLTSKSNLESDSTNTLPKENVEKLLASVSFGYGIVQLCFSFLSTSLIKIASFLGFESDRQHALEALRYTSHSNDIRAPFADAALILYSTIGVWLFGYSEVEMYLTPDEVNEMVNKNLDKSTESCLFYYMKAKYYQLLMKDNQKAFEFYQVTFQNARGAREVESVLFYEITFLNLTNLNFNKAIENFIPFAKNSNWSKPFNSYVHILLNGCLGNFNELKENLNEALKLPVTRNPIDSYSQKRLQYLNSSQSEISKELCEFLIIELLYLWVLIPYCSPDTRDTLIKSIVFILSAGNHQVIRVAYPQSIELYSQQKTELLPIKYLILGAIHLEKSDIDTAKRMFDKVITNTDNHPIMKYTHPYAYCHLCSLAIASNQLDEAKQHLKSAYNYSSFELHQRLNAHMRSLNRQIEDKIAKTI